MKVGVIGLGYVGLPLAVAFAEEGHEVVGLDVDARRLEALGQGRSYVEDIHDETLAPLTGRLHPTSSYADLASCHAVIVCVQRKSQVSLVSRRSSLSVSPLT